VLKVINLEEGFPTIEEARQKMKRELNVARQSGCKGVKFIHGYGSTGAGGGIRIAIGRTLQEMKRDGELACVIFGENWSVADSEAWSLVKQYPALKQDADLGRKNRGITIVWF
jgi:hypothetical protein